jgi:uncharacterized phiE125 gp8 family phage protein
MKKVTTQPAHEPLDLAEVKLFCRVDGNADDNLLEAMIKSARLYFERTTNFSLIERTVELKLERFPADGKIKLTPAPVTAITSFQYYDESNVQQTVNAAIYEAVLEDAQQPLPSYIRLKPGQAWPSTTTDLNYPITITFKSGVASPSNVPPAAKQALLMLIADMYQNRESKVIGSIVADNKMAYDMMFPFKVF